MNEINVVEFLKTVPGFVDVPLDDLHSIATLFKIKSLHTGELVIRQGEMGRSMFIIYQGMVNITLCDQNGKVKLTATLGPTDVIGEMALLTREPRSANVIAITDLVVLELDGDYLFPLLQMHPPLAQFLTTILEQRILENGPFMIYGKYMILEKIGQGQTATVYSGVNPDLDRLVAIKMLHHSLALDGQFVARFLDEARIVATLYHPNIVQIFDLINIFGTFFIVMEKVSGNNLKSVLYDRKKLFVKETIAILRQLVSALHYAHGLGIIHRDIKPANCVLNHDGTIKLMDFGLARRLVDARSDSGVVMGSPKYIAPEIIRGAAGDERSDIYALGVMAFEMLTGQTPFNGPTVRDVLIGHIRETPPDIAKLIPDLPKGLLEFIKRALEKDPAARVVESQEIKRLLDRRQQSRVQLRQGVRPKFLRIEGSEAATSELVMMIQQLCDEKGCRVALIKNPAWEKKEDLGGR